MVSLSDIFVQFGPAIVAGFFSIVFTMIFFLLKKVWINHDEKIDSMSKTISNLSQEYDKILIAIQNVRSEMRILYSHDDTIKQGMVRLEGVISSQQQMLYNHIEKISKVDSKLDALFRFIDAPKRATDIGRDYD